MKRFWYLGAIALLVILSAAIFYGVRAQQPEPKSHPVAPPFERMRLNLTDAQKDQIHNVVIQTRKESIRKRADLNIAEIELRELISDKKVPDETIRSKQTEVQRLREQVGQSRMNALLQVRQILTDEQWAKAKGMHLFMQRRFMWRGGQGNQWMGPGRQMRMGPGQQMRMHGGWGMENRGDNPEQEPLFGEWESILGGNAHFSDNFGGPENPVDDMGIGPELQLMDLIR